MPGGRALLVWGALLGCGSPHPRETEHAPPPPTASELLLATVGDAASRPPVDAGPAPDAPPAAVDLKHVDQPFAIARACKDVRAGTAKATSLDAMPATLRTPKKIAPSSRGYLFSADGSHVLYQDGGGMKSVPVDGGTAVAVSDADVAALHQRRPLAELVPLYQAKTHGDVTPLSWKYLAIGLATHGAETERMFIADLDAGQLIPVAADGLFTIWGAARVDDHRVAFIGRDHHMYVADAATRTLSCASLAAKGDIQGFYHADADFLVFLAGQEVHVADLSKGIDHTLAKLPADAATVVFAAVPNRPGTFVAHVERRAKDERQLFVQIDAKAPSIVRITDPIPGWSNLYLSSDGAYVLFASGYPVDPDARPPKPPAREPVLRPGERRGTCDRMGCAGCGWQSDGCYDYEWCGHCPNEPKPPPPPATDGIYTFAL